MAHLLLVYNADDGFFNKVTDSVHKLISPATYSCWLCRYTHGTFGMLSVWRDFLQDLPCEVAFEHRNRFQSRTKEYDLPLPAILWQQEEGFEVLIRANEIDAEGGSHTDRLDELMARLRSLVSARTGGLISAGDTPAASGARSPG